MKKITTFLNDVAVIGLIYNCFVSVHFASMRQEKVLLLPIAVYTPQLTDPQGLVTGVFPVVGPVPCFHSAHSQRRHASNH